MEKHLQESYRHANATSIAGSSPKPWVFLHVRFRVTPGHIVKRNTELVRKWVSAEDNEINYIERQRDSFFTSYARKIHLAGPNFVYDLGFGNKVQKKDVML